MKARRFFIVVLTLGALIGASNSLSGSISREQYSLSYPSVLCPPTLSALSSQISLGSRNTKIHRVGSTSAKFVKSRALRIPIPSDPVLVDAQGITPIVWQSRTGSWAGGTICSDPAASQWFVGGSADITSRGKLFLVNSGLSESVADVYIWSGSAPATAKAISIKANSYQSLGLDSLAPGESSIVVRVVSRSGRLNAFIVDERGKGLRTLGGDLVSPGIAPSKQIYIPAIPLQQKIKNAPPQQLRLLAPGDVDANVSVEIISGDGRFTPVGFDDIILKKGQVMNFPISPAVNSSVYGIKINSDEPIVAGVFANVGKDFVWSSSVPALTPFTIALTGMSPLLVFVGKSINVEIELSVASGKKLSKTIKGSDIAFWRVPGDARNLTFLRISGETYAAALQKSVNGFGSIPLVAGSVLSKSAIPSANIRVLNP
ncbi:unannotated protein [freshwater metagenome]|jgi:hypothetical protein|uniref:Unannotated protein n=1 Tax=freshwater metagenome TaxID=449393 RepID=A0A6J7GX95_9ZZZZ|nr:hypothetical protein [Actinomycetota bacterium]